MARSWPALLTVGPVQHIKHQRFLSVRVSIGLKDRQPRYLAAGHFQERSGPQALHKRRVVVVPDVLIDDVLPHPVSIEGHEAAVVDEILQISTVIWIGQGGGDTSCIKNTCSYWPIWGKISSSRLAHLPPCLFIFQYLLPCPLLQKPLDYNRSLDCGELCHAAPFLCLTGNSRAVAWLCSCSVPRLRGPPTAWGCRSSLSERPSAMFRDTGSLNHAEFDNEISDRCGKKRCRGMVKILRRGHFFGFWLHKGVSLPLATKTSASGTDWRLQTDESDSSVKTAAAVAQPTTT